MTVYMGTNDTAFTPRPAVGTVGMFDGVHVGHQKVIEETLRWAGQLDVRGVVVTFNHHPLSVLGKRPPPLLTPLGHKLKLIERLGAHDVVVLNFTGDMAALDAESFIAGTLEEKLGLIGLVMGFNNGIGQGKSGTYERLSAMKGRFGLEIRRAAPHPIDGHPVSTTRIRRALAAGRLDDVARMLSRPYSVYGTVVHGDARGRLLGFPTANLDTQHEMTPPEGVYAGKVEIDGETFGALANIGRRPTFDPDDAKPQFEVFIDGYDGDLYGRHIEFQFIRRVRGEIRFHTPDALVERIRLDMETLRAIVPARSAKNAGKILDRGPLT